VQRGFPVICIVLHGDVNSDNVQVDTAILINTGTQQTSSHLGCSFHIRTVDTTLWSVSRQLRCFNLQNLMHVPR
jgi:hypothetical protein